MTNTPVLNRILGAHVEIASDDEQLIEFQHGLFCQLALPRSRQESREWQREYQKGIVKIEAGALYDGRKMVPQPLPYGPKPRLALIHINSEAVRTRSRFIDIESSAHRFLERLGLNGDGGSTYRLFKVQMKALAACRMTLGYWHDGKPTTLDSKPIRRFEAWLTRENNQPVFWPAELELATDYFNDLIDHAVPLDGRAIRALAHSALALDAYCFLARRLHSLKKPVLVTWRHFHAQFGHEYAEVKPFRQKWVQATKAALAVYPDARVELVRGGLLLHPSKPPVHRESLAISHGLADSVQRKLPRDAD
jgi:Plasmid encoded RepA protein